MLKIALFIISFAFLIAGFSWLSGNEGSVNIQWLDYNISTNTTIAFSVLLFVIAGILLVLELFLYIINIPKKISKHQENNRKNDLLRLLTQGFSAILTQDIDSANKSSQKAIKLLKGEQQNEPLVNILCATSASLSNNQQQADYYYNKMLDNKSTKLAGIKGLISSKIVNDDYKNAIALAEQAVELQDDNAKNILNLLYIYKKAQAWVQAREFLQTYSTRKWNKIPNNPANLEQEKSFILFMQAQDEFSHSSNNLGSSLVLQSHQLDYSFITATISAAESALKQGKQKLALAICIKGWRYNPHPDIAELYFNIYPDLKISKQLNLARKLADSNPTAPDSYKVLAEKHLLSDNIGKAIQNTQRALQKRQSSDLYTLMIEIIKAKYIINNEEELDNIEKNNVNTNGTTQEEQIKFWQEKADNAQDSMAWQCNDCNNITGNKWQAECPSCGNLGHIFWKKIDTSSFTNSTAYAIRNSKNIATDLIITQNI